MSDEWWKLSPEDLAANEQALRAKQIAYYSSFYAREENRQVMLDLQRLCYAEKGNSDSMIARIELFNIIRGNCGASIDSEKAAIDAEADVMK